MSIERQIPDTDPLMIAWNAHKETEAFANSKKWATHTEHVEGSLWALFYAGFTAGQSVTPAGVTAQVGQALTNTQIADAVRPLYSDDVAAEMGLPDDIRTAHASPAPAGADGRRG